MTQASPQAKTDNKTPAPAPSTAPKPADKPADKPDDKTATSPATPAPAAKKGASRIFIATGPVYEFETAAKAEKFLNGGGEVPAPATYTVLRGKRIGTSQKVSLR